MTGHGAVEQVLFSPDGRRLYTGNADGTLHIWTLDPVPGRDDHQILIGHEAKISALVMPADGRFLVSASLDGSARVWPMSPAELVRLACHATGRSPSPAEWMDWLPGQPYTRICD